MIRYNVTNCKGENPMWSRLFIIGGDGDSTSLSIPLEASPVGMEFRGDSKPSLAIHRAYGGTDLNRLSINEGILTFEFSRPPANGEWMHIPVEFYYE